MLWEASFGTEVGGELRAISEQFVVSPVGDAHMKGESPRSRTALRLLATRLDLLKRMPKPDGFESCPGHHSVVRPTLRLIEAEWRAR